MIGFWIAARIFVLLCVGAIYVTVLVLLASVILVVGFLVALVLLVNWVYGWVSEWQQPTTR